MIPTYKIDGDGYVCRYNYTTHYYERVADEADPIRGLAYLLSAELGRSVNLP